jgi:integrase
VLCGLTTGFRRNEILGLRWEHIDFKGRVIHLSGQLYWKRVGPGRGEREPVLRKCKYDSERDVPLWSGLADLLAQRQQASGWVFTDPKTGTVWREERPTRVALEPAYEGAGLRRSGHMWHVLRHTYASVLAAGGVRRHELEQLMGHATQGTTGIYTHLFRESYEAVHAALDAVYGKPGPQLRVITRHEPDPPSELRRSGAARF